MLSKGGVLFHYHAYKLNNKFNYQKDLETYQNYQLTKLFKFISKKIPYYKQHNCKSISELPIVDKHICHEKFSLLNSIGITDPNNTALIKSLNLHINSSLGTSGVSSKYLFSRSEILESLGHLFANLFEGLTRYRQKVAILQFAEHEYFSRFCNFHRMEFKNFDLNIPYQSLVQDLHNFQPSIIFGPAKILAMLATEQRKGNIQLATKKLFTYHDGLLPADQEKLKDTFKINPQPIYQTAEGVLASCCQHGSLHFNEDLFYIEQERLCSSNKYFVPIITSLTRRVMPLVRYRLDDVILPKQGDCACGNKMLAIEQIKGRCEDILYFPSISRELIPIYPVDFHNVMHNLREQISDYQILQRSYDLLIIKVQCHKIDAVKENIEQNCIMFFNNKGLKCPKLLIAALDKAPQINDQRRIRRDLLI